MKPGRASWAAAGSLIRKDLRLLRPMLIGLSGLQLLGLIVQGVLAAPDRATLFSLDGLAKDGFSEVFENLLVALLAAFVVLPGERDARTDQFLATLPVRPRSILAAKLGVITAVALANGWLNVTTDWGLALCNPDSFSQRQLTGGALALALGMATLLACICAAHGFWLSFHGRLAWIYLVLATVAAGFLVAADPSFGRLGPGALIALQHHGTAPLFPWAAVFVHVTLAALGLWWGASSWLRERKPPAVVGLIDRPGLGKGRLLLIALGGGGGFIAVLGLASHSFWTPRLQSQGVADPADEDRVQEQTAGRFVFTYLPEDAAKVQTLARDAEVAYGRIRAWLGAPAIDRIDVDLTFSGVEVEGITLGARVNMDISHEPKPEERRAVMAHELVHVFQHALSHGARPDQVEPLRFVAEGQAEEIVFDLYGAKAQRRESQLRAAWARQRYRIHLGDLFEPARFVTSYDEQWWYDFGQRWIGALVAICGRNEAAQMFRRLAEPDLPKSLTGVALVRDLLQRDHCSYDRVEAHYEDQLSADKAAAEILPTVRTRFRGRDGQRFAFDVHVTAPDPDPRDVVLVLRADPATSARNYITHHESILPGQAARITVGATGLDGPRFQYRAGIQPQRDANPLFSRWRWTSIERQVETAMP